MGANGSRRDHYAVDHFHRRLLQKTRSMSTTEYQNTSNAFYPPPILHNLCPVLDNNPTIKKEFGAVVAGDVHRLRSNTFLVDKVLTKTTKEPGHEQVTAKASSASTASDSIGNRSSSSSSSSSGCESSVSDDNLEHCPDQQQSSSAVSAAPKHPCHRSRLYVPRIPRHHKLSKRPSVDSGTGFDDDDSNNTSNATAAVPGPSYSRNTITKRRTVSLCVTRMPQCSILDHEKQKDLSVSALINDTESNNSENSSNNNSTDDDDDEDGDDEDHDQHHELHAKKIGSFRRRSYSLYNCNSVNDAKSSKTSRSKLSTNYSAKSCGHLPLAVAAAVSVAAATVVVAGDHAGENKKERKKHSKSIGKSLKSRLRAFSTNSITFDELKKKSK